MKRLLPVAATLGLLAALGLAANMLRLRLGPQEQFRVIQNDYARAEEVYHAALRAAKTGDERRKAAAEVRPHPGPYAARFLELAKSHPDSPQSLAALCWAVINAPDTPPGKAAFAILAGGRLARTDPSEIERALVYTTTSMGLRPTPLGPLILDRIRRNPGHPRAARLLTWVCSTYLRDESPQEPPTFAEAAEIIATRFPDSPDIAEFCEYFGYLADCPPWAGNHEIHLRTILDKNPNRLVRCAALYGLASVVDAQGEPRRREAEATYRRLVESFDGSDPSTKPVEDGLILGAKRNLEEIRLDAGLSGQAAREIEGDDLDGRPMKLTDYRGKVVLVSFWATWCPPCMGMIPHERSLLARQAGKPFAIVGVNGDDDPEEMRRVLAKTEIPWRSFRDKRAGQGSISEEWAVNGWPTFFLIDHEGVVRRRWTGPRRDEDLDREIAPLVEAARQAVGAAERAGFPRGR